MKSTIAVLSAALTLAAASPIIERQETQSKPFYLTLSGSSYNGQKLGACHEGAAIESLCVGYSSVYNLNTTNGQIYNATYGQPGELTYTLKGSNFNESEPMTFFYDPSTNVALPLFEPTETGQQVAFDNKNRMNVQTYLNDQVNPPTDTTLRALYRWYVCKTNFEGYVYETLAWTAGSGKPENPSCQKVDVIRHFA